MRHPRRGALRLVLDLILLAVVMALFFIRFYVYRPVQVVQESMEPTLRPGDQLLVNTWRIRQGLPPRGAIVVICPEREPEWLVKRVVGVPGDAVAIGPWGLAVNGRSIREPYVRPFAESEVFRTKVPPGSVYVLGDNRPHSNDSRDFGAVAQADIVGEVVAVLAPKSRRRAITPAAALK